MTEYNGYPILAADEAAALIPNGAYPPQPGQGIRTPLQSARARGDAAGF